MFATAGTTTAAGTTAEQLDMVIRSLSGKTPIARGLVLPEPAPAIAPLPTAPPAAVIDRRATGSPWLPPPQTLRGYIRPFARFVLRRPAQSTLRPAA